MAITAEDLKKLSPKMLALLLTVVFLLLGYFYWFFLFNDAWEKRTALQAKTEDLARQIADKERIAAQKDKFLKEVKALKEAFAVALAKLPDQREIPGLFQAVSVAGREAGIDFLLFEPKPPEKPATPEGKGAEVRANLKPSDQRAEQKPGTPSKGGAAPAGAADRFYEEIPVKVIVNGGFVNTVFFFDKVSRLPRIVNIEGVSIGDAKDVPGRGRLTVTSCEIKTYMFTEKMDKGGRGDDKKR
ncbi:MAG: type 4a pilus biogenesis protein PilO [Pseudomonadota bacterium]|nr:type 4a pilus biogenesis protein PilO [Pseudomonadota bacterium]